MANSEPFVSVVIPTQDKVERLRVVLAAFALQTLGRRRFEVIVVDDGSADQTPRLLATLSMPFSLRHLRQERAGRASARNAGVAAARGELLVFCDDDTIPRPGYLEAHRQAHTGGRRLAVHGAIYSLPYLKFFRDPVAGVLYEGQDHHGDGGALRACLLVGPPAAVLEQCERQKKVSPFEQNVQRVLAEPGHPMRWLGCTGGNLSLSRRGFDEAGGFDPGFGLAWGGEDLELGYRLVEQGVAIELCAEAACFHINHHRATLRAELEQSMRRFRERHDHRYVRHLGKLLLGEIADIAAYCRHVEAEEVHGDIEEGGI
jgi:glycosyltransferase involved in cell wall biosynthesis